MVGGRGGDRDWAASEWTYLQCDYPGWSPAGASAHDFATTGCVVFFCFLFCFQCLGIAFFFQIEEISCKLQVYSVVINNF